MEAILLAKSTTPIIGWVAELLGIIMEAVFRVTSSFGIINIGLCIIIFTIIINIAMLPLTIKQQKSSKLMSVMQPEIQAIQKKYKGKNDTETAMKIQAETKAVQEKYGTSMVGGCLQTAIQLPILFALYQVIIKIPSYVPTVKVYFERIALSLQQQDNYIGLLGSFATKYKMPADKIDYHLADNVIDLLYKFNPGDWTEVSNLFPALSKVLSENVPTIERMNSFLGINLASNPFQGFMPNPAWIIPILAGLTQWYSTKLMTSTQTGSANDEANSVAQQMKTVNNVMPLMSVYFCFMFPAGVGLYWIASAVCRIIQQIIINKHLEKIDIDKLVEENLRKSNEKRAKKGLPLQTINKNILEKAKQAESAGKENEEKKREINARQIKDSTEYYNKNAKPGSIASRANMVAVYNARTAEKKSGKKTKDQDGAKQEEENK